MKLELDKTYITESRIKKLNGLIVQPFAIWEIDTYACRVIKPYLSIKQIFHKNELRLLSPVELSLLELENL